MTSYIYGYARVSTRQQELNRGLAKTIQLPRNVIGNNIHKES